jgi:hypothetical protein
MHACMFVCIVCMRLTQAIFNRLPNLLWLRARNALLYVSVFENTKCRHLTHSQFVCDVFAFFDVVEVELDLTCDVSPTCAASMRNLRWMERGGLMYVRILPDHLIYLRRNDLAVLTPCCCALENGDAFVHDGFEVLGF